MQRQQASKGKLKQVARGLSRLGYRITGTEPPSWTKYQKPGSIITLYVGPHGAIWFGSTYGKTRKRVDARFVSKVLVEGERE